MSSSVRIGIQIMPRDVILDTQGRAIEQTLRLNNLEVEQCRVGRYVELKIQGEKAEALKKAEEIAKKLLCNSLIETFEMKVL